MNDHQWFEENQHDRLVKHGEMLAQVDTRLANIENTQKQYGETLTKIEKGLWFQRWVFRALSAIAFGFGMFLAKHGAIDIGTIDKVIK